MAEIFLKKKGFLILDKNWRSHLGEIDIVALKPRSFWQRIVFPRVLSSSQIVFVEVKGGGFLAAERIGRFKQEKLKQLALLYLKQKGLFANSFRIDAVIVRFMGKKAKVKHLVSAVEE